MMMAPVRRGGRAGADQASLSWRRTYTPLAGTTRTEVDEALVDRGGADAGRSHDELGAHHSAKVAARADHARDDAERGARDEGDDAEVEALGHLDEEREEDEHNQSHIPLLIVAHAPKSKEEDRLV